MLLTPAPLHVPAKPNTRARPKVQSWPSGACRIVDRTHRGQALTTSGGRRRSGRLSSALPSARRPTDAHVNSAELEQTRCQGKGHGRGAAWCERLDVWCGCERQQQRQEVRQARVMAGKYVRDARHRPASRSRRRPNALATERFRRRGRACSLCPAALRTMPSGFWLLTPLPRLPRRRLPQSHRIPGLPTTTAQTALRLTQDERYEGLGGALWRRHGDCAKRERGCDGGVQGGRAGRGGRLWSDWRGEGGEMVSARAAQR